MLEDGIYELKDEILLQNIELQELRAYKACLELVVWIQEEVGIHFEFERRGRRRLQESSCVSSSY